VLFALAFLAQIDDGDVGTPAQRHRFRSRERPAFFATSYWWHCRRIEGNSVVEMDAHYLSCNACDKMITLKKIA
jgi:hypothetical protein